MQKVHNYAEKREQSKEDELIVGNWIASRPDTIWVRNVTEDPEYWPREIDFVRYTIRQPKHGVSYEVKCCDVIHSTGRIFLEIIQNVWADPMWEGAWKVTEAKYWLYLDQVKRILYQFEVEPAKSWLRHKGLWREFTRDGREQFYESRFRKEYPDGRIVDGMAHGICIPWPRMCAASATAVEAGGKPFFWIHKDWQEEILWDASRLVRAEKEGSLA